jgi:hypothetical protein
VCIDEPKAVREALEELGLTFLKFGQVLAPGLESLGNRLSRNPGRLTSAIAYAALVIGGSMLLMNPMGYRHDKLGITKVVSGIAGMLITGIVALRRNHNQR